MKNHILLPWTLFLVLTLFRCPESTNGQGNGIPFGFLFEAKAKIEQILETGQNWDIPSLIEVISGVSADALKFPLLQCPSGAGGNFKICLEPVQNKIQEIDSNKTNQQVVENKVENCGLLQGVYYCANKVLDTCSGKAFVSTIPHTVQDIITPKLNQLGCDKSVFDNSPYVPLLTLTTLLVPTTTPVPTTAMETSRTDSSTLMAARTTPAPLLLTTSESSNGHSNHGQDMSFPFKLTICLVTFFHTFSYLCTCL